jgi:DNA-directed RNA polymerase II subunit RPB2
MRHANYEKLDQNGNMPVNALVEDRDIIMAKVMPIKENKNNNAIVIKYEDHSRSYRTDEECYIDRVYTHRNGDGYNFNKVRIRTQRVPVIGDKFSSRGAQKGTIGTILPECDVPFTASGLRPDIIINPHCMPSRMTIGQLKESLMGQLLLELGLFGDGTSFTDLNVHVIRNELVRNGFHSNGDEVMYDGVTGEQIDMPVFIGPTFYQRLKHMVNDKCHSRNIGPMVSLTRQPAEGRSRDGGLRFGEMERDCMISHGAATFIKTRMFDCSDKYETHVCKMCGVIASINHDKHIHKCNLCQNTTSFALVQIPYACKLMFQELVAMNIAPRIVTEN